MIENPILIKRHSSELTVCRIQGFTDERLPLNKSNPDLLINVHEYWQVSADGKIIKFIWVTDIPITLENVFQLMQAGRARWKVEDETFNTIKNQGYNFGHNYGLGKKNLSAVFAILMMLAFLID